MVHLRDSSIAGQEDDHTIVATARGIFDGNGGTLESKETGTGWSKLNVSLVVQCTFLSEYVV